MIYFSCPHCQKVGEASADMAGKIVLCPGCRQHMQVPAGPSVKPAPGLQLVQEAPPPSPEEKVRFYCPSCRKRLRARSDAIGSVIVCRRCRQRLYVPFAAPSGKPVVAKRATGGDAEPSQYYYAKDGVRHGPVLAPELRAMAQKGTLLRTDLIWKRGMPDWTPASKLHGLFSRDEPPPLPTPPAVIVPTIPPLGDSGALVNRGVAAAEKGDYNRALADLNDAIRRDPANAQAYASRAVIHAQVNRDFAKAVADLTEAICLAPQELVLHEFRAVFYRALGGEAKAIADERRAAELKGRGMGSIILGPR